MLYLKQAARVNKKLVIISFGVTIFALDGVYVTNSRTLVRGYYGCIILIFWDENAACSAIVVCTVFSVDKVPVVEKSSLGHFRSIALGRRQ